VYRYPQIGQLCAQDAYRAHTVERLGRLRHVGAGRPHLPLLFINGLSGLHVQGQHQHGQCGCQARLRLLRVQRKERLGLSDLRPPGYIFLSGFTFSAILLQNYVFIFLVFLDFLKFILFLDFF
jgi:hypothetical protein